MGKKIEAPLSQARWLKESWKMGFDKAYTGWQEKHLTQGAAVRLLGVCDYTFRRQIGRYETEGMDGMACKRLAKSFASAPPCIAMGYLFLWFMIPLLFIR